jgi:hypothetical protein
VISLKVTPDDGEPYVVVAHARDVLVWERSGRDRSFGTLMEDLKFSNLYDLAFIAATRQGLNTLPDRKAFEAMCDVEPHAEEDAGEAPDPTRKGR